MLDPTGSKVDDSFEKGSDVFEAVNICFTAEDLLWKNCVCICKDWQQL
jgi:hypothetical protein